MSETSFVDLLQDAADAPPDQKRDSFRRLRDAFVVGSPGLSADEINLFDEFVDRYFSSATLLDRIAFANAVVRNSKLSPRLRRRLLDDNPMVAAPIIEHAALDDADLISLIDPADETVQMSIAKRKKLSETVSDLLIGVGKDKVLRAVAANVTAQISMTGFEILSDAAIKDPEMDAALAKRPDLPPAIAKKLTRALEMRTRERLSVMIERDIAKTRRPFVLR